MAIIKMYASSMPEKRRDQDEHECRNPGFRIKSIEAMRQAPRHGHLRHACSRVSTQQRVGRTGGQSEVPGNQVPCDRADEPGQNHVRRNDVHIDALNYGFRHMRAESESGYEVEKRGPDYGLSGREHARCNDGGDGIRRVMKAVNVIKCERNRDDDYDEE